MKAAPPLIYLSAEFIRAKEYLEAILASTSDAVCTTDLGGRLLYFSPGAEKLFGLSAREAVGLPAWRFYRDGRAEAARIMRELLERGGLSDRETVALCSQGREIPVSMSVSLLRGRDGSWSGTLGISKDIRRRVELERRLRELSITDELTGLYNQRCFQERAAAEIQRARRQGEPLSLLLLDLDHFKQANDLWGHVEGDRILKETAVVLTACIRKDVDAAFRYGGDEFVVLLPGLGSRLAERVAGRIAASAAAKPYARLVTPSIGCASLRAQDDLTGLLRRADARMYKRKEAKRRQAPIVLHIPKRPSLSWPLKRPC